MLWVSILNEGRMGLAAGSAGASKARYEGDPGGPGDPLAWLRSGVDLVEAGLAFADAPAIDLADVTVLPPLPRPPKVICVGLNYADHAKGIGAKPTKVPEISPRLSTSLVGHGSPIVRPVDSVQLDWGSELAVVIGRRGRRIDRRQALDHVAGHSIFDEAIIRDFQFRTSQFTFGKNFDGTRGFGPWLVTADEVPPGGEGLRIIGRRNGEIAQDVSTDLTLFDVATLIADISGGMTLEPGNVIVTGTPAGIGFERKPTVFLVPEDVFEVEIEKMGVLRNSVVDESEGVP